MQDAIIFRVGGNCIDILHAVLALNQASQRVRVGKACYVGANCSITNGVSMGDLSLAGIGAVVLKEVAEKSVVTRNPARIIRAAC